MRQRPKYRLLNPHFRRLARMRRVGDVEGLIRELGNDFQVAGLTVRSRAAHNLGRLGSEKAVEPLLRLLSDREEDSRAAAARALGQIGSREAVPTLIQALGDPSPVVRPHVMASLVAIGDPQAVQYLMPSLSDSSYMWFRAPAISALLLIEDADANEAARRQLDREAWWAKIGLERSLRKVRRRRAELRRARQFRRSEHQR
jgi:HEAT repeat protein